MTPWEQTFAGRVTGCLANTAIVLIVLCGLASVLLRWFW